MGLMRRLVEARGFGSLEPAQELLATNEEGIGHRRAARSTDRRHVLAYTPLGLPVVLREIGECRASWFDPRTERKLPARSNRGIFDPPMHPGRGNAWVLVLERPSTRNTLISNWSQTDIARHLKERPLRTRDHP